MLRTLRFLKQHLRPSERAVTGIETTYARGEASLPATIYRPAGARGRLPGWALLHGLTYTGREHPGLVAFGRALAASGTVVMVPDVPEWRALRIAPAISEATIRAVVIALTERPEVAAGSAGLIAFSFGATQALIAATDRDVQSRLSAVVAWGGYADVHRLFRFGITGRHDLDGAAHQLEPDPYGAWVVGANYLTGVPGHEDDGDVAAALSDLSEDAGRRRTYAGDPVYDPIKARIRGTLPRDKWQLFDLFARPSGRTAARRAEGRWTIDEIEAFSAELADAALRRDPLLDPQPFLPRVEVPTIVAHAVDDRLVPFTEGIRLSRALPARSVRHHQVIGLFSHSGRPHEALRPLGLVRESYLFMRLLGKILGSL